MKTLHVSVAVTILLLLLSCSSSKVNRYDGVFCSGTGDLDYLRLIDESFAFFHPNPVVPNLSMVYRSDWNTFEEGAGWGAWWIQNSYGFSYAATPFLEEPWFTLLQRSWDLFWDNQGDGKRMSMWGGSPDASRLSSMIAPDGCLGDAAAPGQIVFKQGDGNVDIHDWFFEATAAGVVMQAEIFLAERDTQKIISYLPRMERACDFIETARDSTNNLFLVGPACNLLAPSYGGVIQPDGTFGKGYLAGLTITYLAALDRMVELYKLTGNQEKLDIYEHRRSVTRESLLLLKAPAGYFVKSLEPDGKKHGVLGQEQYGYLEGVANADAVALRVADDPTAKAIYDQIAAFPEIRPFDFLLTNAPGLDDSYWSWGNTAGDRMKGFHEYGTWVNGGVWGTVEGRAILMYYRLGKYEDIRRSASRAMKWAKDFRMDAPWSQRGENTHNPWSDSGKHKQNGVAVMIDNFAIPAATIRGLFDYEYKADRIILRPRIPESVNTYTQKRPIRFGDKKLHISCVNGGPEIKSVKINGKKIPIGSPSEIVLPYDELPVNAEIEIVTTGKKSDMAPEMNYPSFPVLEPIPEIKNQDVEQLPDSLKRPYQILSTVQKALEKEKSDAFDMAFVNSAIGSFDSYILRTALDPGPGYFRPIDPERKEGMIRFYEFAAINMFKGFEIQMKHYEENGTTEQKRVAAIYRNALDQ